MTEQIIDLNGHIFKVGSRYRLGLDYPLYRNAEYRYTRDRITDNIFTLIQVGNKYKCLLWSNVLGLYVIRKLILIRYEEKFDIKFEWKYQKELRKFYKEVGKNS